MQAVVVAIVSGVFTGVAAGITTMIAMRVEIRWIKAIMKETKEGVRVAHQRLDMHIKEEHLSCRK